MITRITLILFIGIILSGSTAFRVDATLFEDLVQEASKIYTKTKEEIEKSRKKDEERSGTKRTQPPNKVVSPVPEVQELLNQLGYDAGPINGALTEKTRSAIKVFKRNHHMHVDDRITDSLIQALRRARDTMLVDKETEKRSPIADYRTPDQHPPPQQSEPELPPVAASQTSKNTKLDKSEIKQESSINDAQKDINDAAVPITGRYMLFLTLRDNPQLRQEDDDYLLWQIERQISYEQKQWKHIDRKLAQWKKNPSDDVNVNGKKRRIAVNQKRPAFIYEWQKLVKDHPSFANGPILDLFWQSDPDWSFLKQEKEWDDQLLALADLFIFAREKIEGRDPKVAARELLPVWKQHCDAVFERPPQEGKILVSEFFKSYVYDFETQSLRLKPEVGKKSDLFNRERNPDSDQQTFLYTLPGSFLREGVFSNERWRRNRIPNIISSSLPGRWLEHFIKTSSYSKSKYEILAYESALSLDHLLGPASIPMRQDEAKDLIKKVKNMPQNYYFEARLIIEPIRTEFRLKENSRNRVFPLLFGDLVRVEYLTPAGEVITSFGPDTIPSYAAENTKNREETKEISEEQTDDRHVQTQKTETYQIKEVQEVLNQLGYDAGIADGVLRDKTKLAIKAYKRNYQMHVDDQITESLILALRKARNIIQKDNGTNMITQSTNHSSLDKPSLQQTRSDYAKISFNEEPVRDNVVLASDSVWIDDFEIAKEMATKEGKDILLTFSGSDWYQLEGINEDVFSQKTFLDNARKQFVLVEVDFPKHKKQAGKVKAQNKMLLYSYQVEMFPTIVLTDAKGQIYAKIEGDKDLFIEFLNNPNKTAGLRAHYESQKTLYENQKAFYKLKQLKYLMDEKFHETEKELLSKLEDELRQSPKGEFETTEQYNNRIDTAKLSKPGIRAIYKKKIDDARKQIDNEIFSFLEKRHKLEIQNQNLVLGSYSADEQIFPITIKIGEQNVQRKCYIPLEIAPEFKGDFDKIIAKVKAKLARDAKWQLLSVTLHNRDTEETFECLD